MNKGTIIGTATAVAAIATSVALVSQPPAPVPMVNLTWEPNYTLPYEVTVIKSSTNLLTPFSQWTVRFVGAANSCSLPRTNPQEFFMAENALMIPNN